MKLSFSYVGPLLPIRSNSAGPRVCDVCLLIWRMPNYLHLSIISPSPATFQFHLSFPSSSIFQFLLFSSDCLKVCNLTSRCLLASTHSFLQILSLSLSFLTELPHFLAHFHFDCCLRSSSTSFFLVRECR